MRLSVGRVLLQGASQIVLCLYEAAQRPEHAAPIHQNLRVVGLRVEAEL